jgi:hypothetical protein
VEKEERNGRLDKNDKMGDNSKHKKLFFSIQIGLNGSAHLLIRPEWK